MKKLMKASLPLAIALSLVACGGDSDDNTVSMRISATNLEPLGDDFDYEGWIIVDGSAVSTGTFDVEIVDGEVVTVPSEFTLDLTQANAADTFVLSIEPEDETAEEAAVPAATKILAGSIVDGLSDAVTDHPAVFSSDFSEADGTFILATPTNGNETPNQGIWFLDRTETESGGTEGSLSLPILPEGWRYEGWVVDTDGPISTGTFIHEESDDEVGTISIVTGADSDGAGPAAGPLGGPAYPGQDFVDPATILTGLTTVISVEPYPDNSSDPFVMKPLSYAGIGVAVLPPAQGTDDMPLNNVASETLPSAEITIDF